MRVELERQSVPPVDVETSRTLSSVDTLARTFTPRASTRPLGFTLDTEMCPTNAAGTPRAANAVSESSAGSSSSSTRDALASTASAKRLVASAVIVLSAWRAEKVISAILPYGSSATRGGTWEYLAAHAETSTLAQSASVRRAIGALEPLDSI